MTVIIPDIKPLTKRQYAALDIMSKCRYTLLFGGRRSGKTFIILDSGIILRALAKKSRHVIGRLRFNHVKRTIWHETLPDVLKKRYPQLVEGRDYRLNKSDFFVEFKNGSTIWIFGLDDKDRMEKVLGTEYSTAALNESSQLGYDGYEMILSGLAEKSGLTLKFFGDCNPPSKKHWTYKMFIEGKNPDDGKALLKPGQYGHLIMNPDHNRANIAGSYFDILDGMSRRKRDRFRDGLFADDTEGSLWGHDLISILQMDEIEKKNWEDAPLTIVALDPNTADDKKPGEEFTADEAGLIVMSKDTPKRDTSGNAAVIADYSGELSATQWAKKAVWAYHQHNANCIVAEVNQGGALVKKVIQAEDNSIPVKMVHASKGKHIRAEPVVTLDEKGKIKHAPGLDKLEDEMLTWVPGVGKSPNRVDARVWGATYLFLGEKGAKRPILRVR